ncbi:flagellar hook-length control protein FliK [Sphingomonas sp. BGYR3]|uniref:flagellar hook-length control protein FliK n=1 Tax=Sphingomonas sp. BGYR3 TaxID=2975483 RepID=UPI0021A4D55F|nr:flagellar hook-length control protein FliK [Sphingomonas sp. BGYR3]MDG5488301.1 flagellar hook-length control protein FliK [Sphingomonas sp. BGYR3]
MGIEPMPTMLPSFAALPGSPAPGSVSAPGPLAVSAGFGAMLAGLAPAPVKPVIAALPETLAIADRQNGAAIGKTLPVEPLLTAPSDSIEMDTAEPKTSPDSDAAQPASVAEIPFWPMPSPVVQPLPTPAPAPLPDQGQATQTIASPVQPAQTAALPVATDGAPATPAAMSVPPALQPAESPTGPAPVLVAAPAAPAVAAPMSSIAFPPPGLGAMSDGKPLAAAQPSPIGMGQAAPRVSADTDPAPQPLPAAAPPVRAEPVPAAQLFIGQIATALDDRAQRSGARLIDLAVDLAATGPSGGQRAELPGIAVAAPAAADQGRLDMERREWMATMIDRIETIRADGRQDVRIRLSPDALGSIDIRITERSGVADVQVTAEQAGARAMLAEAAPRLSELAESRGLRLTAQFDGSDRQSPGRSPYHPEQDAPSRPRPASSVSTTAEPKARPDDRIA